VQAPRLHDNLVHLQHNDGMLGAHGPLVQIAALFPIHEDPGGYEPPAAAMNHSDGTSDYYVEGELLDSSGANVGTANSAASHVAPGQTAYADLIGVPSGSASDSSVSVSSRPFSGQRLDSQIRLRLPPALTPPLR
jgi:hypothetical protein